MTNSETEVHAHAGQQPVHVDLADPSTYDAKDVGQMYRIRFADGFETDAFADELITI